MASTRASGPAGSAGLDASARHQVEAGIAGGSLLKALSADGRHKLAAAGWLVSLEPSEILFERGDPADAMYVILSGEVEVRAASRDGGEVRFASSGAGGIVGEMGMLDGLPRSADIVASRRTRLWRIPRSAFLDVLRAEPAAAIALIAELGRHLRAANDTLEVMTLHDLGARLARFLVIEAGPSGTVSLTQVEIARRISASREKVNRKLQTFASEGLISLSKSGTRVLDREGLARLFGFGAP